MTSDLSTPSALAEFGNSLSQKFAELDFEQVAKVLKWQALRFRSPAIEAAKVIVAQDVKVEGWAEFNERIESLSSEMMPITAVELNISNYTDDAVDGLRHPVVEISYFRDSEFDFSSQTLLNLRTSAETYSLPWQGMAHEIGDEIELSGLETLNDFIVKCDFDNPASEKETAASIAVAGWHLKLFYHQAIELMLRTQGLSRDIPVIVGCHGVRPWCTTIHHRHIAFRIDAAREPSEKEMKELRATLEYHVRAWREVRARHELFALDDPKDTVRSIARGREMADRWFVGTPFAGTYPLELDERQFEFFLQRWCNYRDPGSVEVAQASTGTALRRKLESRASDADSSVSDKRQSLLSRIFGR